MRHHKQNRQQERINLSEENLSNALSDFRRSYIGKKGLFYRGTPIASRAELSCIKALESYTGWQMLEGKTYQVPIGHQKTVDFKVKEQLVEFHPIILSREMNPDVYRQLKRFAETLDDYKRFELKEIFRIHILEEYAQKRHWTIRQHRNELISNAELIVVTDAESFFKHVIKPNATRRLPTMPDFKKRFKAGKFGD
jgi:hypothetical protein